MAQLQIKPLHPSLGAEIAGVDLSQRSQSRVLWRLIVEGDRPR